MEPSALPNHLRGAADTVGRFRALAEAHGMTPGALALGAVLARPEITSVVLGADTPDQVTELAAMAEVPVAAELIDQAIALARDEPAELFDPSTWPTA